jgi:hypothetical protein
MRHIRVQIYVYRNFRGLKGPTAQFSIKKWPKNGVLSARRHILHTYILTTASTFHILILLPSDTTLRIMYILASCCTVLFNGFWGYVAVCVQLYCVGCHCLTLHVSTYMAIFRCVEYFYFHMPEGICFAGFMPFLLFLPFFFCIFFLLFPPFFLFFLLFSV